MADVDPNFPSLALSRDTLAQVAGAIPTGRGVRTKPAWAPSAFGVGQGDRDRWYDEPASSTEQTGPVQSSAQVPGGRRDNLAAPAPNWFQGNDTSAAGLRAAAQQVEAETGIPAAVLLAIPVNESGNQWGPGATPYGIKAGSGYKGQTTGPVNTWEVYGGQRVDIKDNFRTYNTPAEAMRDFAGFLQSNPRYAPALQRLRQTGDASQFVHDLNRAGYATDPAWGDKITRLMGQQPSGGTFATSNQSASGPPKPTRTPVASTLSAASTSAGTALSASAQPQVAKPKHWFTYVDDGQEVMKIIREDGGQEFHVTGSKSPHPNGTVTDPGNLPIGQPLPEDVRAGMPQWEQSMYAGEGVGSGQDDFDAGEGGSTTVLPPPRYDQFPGPAEQQITVDQLASQDAHTNAQADIQAETDYLHRQQTPPPSDALTPDLAAPPTLNAREVATGYQQAGRDVPTAVAQRAVAEMPMTSEARAATAPKPAPASAQDVPLVSGTQALAGKPDATPQDVAMGLLAVPQRYVMGAIPAKPGTAMDVGSQPNAIADPQGGITNVAPTPEQATLNPFEAVPRAVEREKQAPVQAMAAEFALDPVNIVGGVLGGVVAGARATSWAHRAEEAVRAQKVVPGLTRLMTADEHAAVLALRGGRVAPNALGAGPGALAVAGPPRVVVPDLDAIHLAASQDPVARVVRALSDRLPKPATREITLTPSVAAAHPEGARMVESDINAAARLRAGRPAPGEQVQALYPGGWTQRMVDQRLRTPFTDRLAALETQDTYIHLRDLAIQHGLGFSTLTENDQGYRMARQLAGSVGRAQAWAEEVAAPIFKQYQIHAGEEARLFEEYMRAYEYVQRTNTTDVLDSLGTLLKAGRVAPLPSGPAVGTSQRRAIELLNTILDDAEAKFGHRSIRPMPPANLGPGLALPVTPASVRARFYGAHQALSESLVPTLREAEKEGLLRPGAVDAMLEKHPVYTHIQTLGEHFQGWGRGDVLPRSLPTSAVIRHEQGSERLADVSLDGLFARQTALMQAVERQKIANALEDWRKMDPQGFGQMMRPLSAPEMLNYHRGHFTLKPGTQLVPRFDGGRLQMYEVPDILGDSLMGLNKEQVGMVSKGVGRLTRTFTGLVTAYSPNFIVNNFLRHELSAHHNLQAIAGVEFSRLKVLGLDTVPLPTENRLLLENMLSSFWDSLTSGEKGQNLVSLLSKQRMPTLEERAAMAAANPRSQMRRLGSEVYMRGQAHMTDAARVRNFEEYLPKEQTPLQKAGRAVINIGQPWKAIRAFAEVTEMSTRVNVYKAALAAGVSPEQAAYLGRSVTIDYAKGGTAVKALNMWLPFINSRVQAIGRPLEAFDKNPAKFAVQQAFSTVLPWAVTYALNRSPQWSDMYDRISRFEKQNYFILPVGTFTLPNGQENMLRINIRKDEGSMLITNLMEYMADQMFHTSYAGRQLDPSQRDERSPFDMWLQELRLTVPIPENPSEQKHGWFGLLDSTAMDFPLFNIAQQQMSGTDAFGQPVVPPDQQTLPPELQYGQTYHPSSAVLAEMLGSLSGGKWQPSPAGTSWAMHTIPLGQIAEGAGDVLANRFGIRPTSTPPTNPKAPPSWNWDQLDALQKQKALEDTRPWWAKVFQGVVKSSGGAQSFAAKLEQAPENVRVPLVESQAASREYADWRMQTYYPQRQAVFESATKTGQQKRDELSRLSQQRAQAFEDAYRHHPQAVRDWQEREKLIQQIPGVPVSAATIASAADLDPSFRDAVPQAAAQYMLVQQTFAGQLPPQEVQRRQAQVVQNYAQQWGVDPEVARDAIKAQLNQLQMPVAGVPNAAIDDWTNRYLTPRNEIDYRELDARGNPTGSDDPVLLRRAQAREVERIASETGLSPDTVRQRISLRLTSPEEQTPEMASLSHAQDLVARVHDPTKFPAFIDPITHKPLARADGTPSGPDDWQHWQQQIGAAESQKATPRSNLPESAQSLVAAEAEGKRYMLKQGLWKDATTYVDYLRWYGYGKNLTDQEWADYQNGAQQRYKDVPAADVAEATRRDMVIAEAKVTPTARNRMLNAQQWNQLPEAERTRRISLEAEARRYAKVAVRKWQDALAVDEVSRRDTGAFDQLLTDEAP